MRTLAVVIFSLFVGLFSAAQAQFSVGGVTGGAATANVNCYGDADGKLRAYTDGWRAADCGIYTGICKGSEYPCSTANTLCTDGVTYGTPCPGSHTLIDETTGPGTAGAEYASATNQPPVFNAVSCNNAIVGKPYSCQVTAIDNDAVTYSVASAPSWLSINSTSGAMTGTPPSKTTEATFTVTATDSYGKTDTETVNAITVGNTVPLWSSTPVGCDGAATGAQYSCAMSASDSDAHNLTYTLVNGPSWMTINASTGTISGTPDSSADFSNVELSVTDGYDPVSSTTFNITVSNNAPVFAAFSCPTIGTVGTAYSCAPSATDADTGHSITYALLSAPSWMSINASTGAISGTVTSAAGSGVTVTATDSYDTTSATAFNVAINNAPSFASFSCPAIGTVGSAYTCTAAATDSDGGDTVTYSLTNAPSWMSINSSGVISGTVTAEAGNNVIVSASDSKYTTSASSFNVGVNNAPSFASFSCPAIGTIGSAYSCAAGATDLDSGDTLSYTLDNAPSWMSIDSSGNISGTVANAAGSNVIVKASDGTDTTLATAFNVAVNHAPTISSVSCADGLDTAAYTCSVSASDSDSGDSLTYTIANKPSWASISSSGVITGTAQTGTTSNITVTVSDGTDTATSNTFSITIDPNTATKLADSSSVLTTSDVDDLATLGVSSTITNDLKNNNNCGSAGNQSCLAAFNSQKTSTSCTAVSSSATSAQMQTYVNCVMKEHHTAVANAVTISPASNVVAGSSCSSSPDINVAAPSGCGHSQWTCSLVNSPTGWTYNSSGNYIVIPGDTNQTGSKSVTVRMSLGIYTPAYTKDVTFTQDVTAAVSNATNGKKYFTRSDFNYNAARNKCILHGGRLATKDEAISHHNPGLFAPNTSNPTLQKGNTSTYGDVSCSKTFSVGQNYTCRASGHWGRVWTNSYCFYGHSGNDCDAVSTSATKGFTCVGVSSCPSS